MLDADQLGVLHSLGRGRRPERERPGDGGDPPRSGRAGITSAAQHTQANFKTAFWRTEVLDYEPFETWAEEGARDSMQLANARVQRMLADYEAPALDPGIAEALNEFVDRRKAAEPDAFG